jgi:ArsR family transcriptional regulator, arsenate/arsenite/antimonite-responsive transcriptional repressor
MPDAIVHRGPDEEGFLAPPPVVACSRRRSVIELPRGSQPIWNETGTLAVVFDRVIYEFRELRNELKANGHTIRTRCEVVDQTSGADQSASSSGCNQSKLRSRRLWRTPIVEVYARDRTNGNDPRQVAALNVIPYFCNHRTILSTPSKKNAEQVARFADMNSAMGAEHKLRIMQLLLSAHPEGTVVGEIQSELDIPNSTLSHHLDKLQNENLVIVKRENTFLRYCANIEALQGVLQFLYVRKPSAVYSRRANGVEGLGSC